MKYKAIKEIALKTALGYLEKDPEKNMPKLMNWVDKLAGTGPDSFESQRAAVRAVVEIMTETYGNPSSLHSMGFAAEMKLREARETVAGMLSAKPEEILFTSGGTESNNLALFSAAQFRLAKSGD